MIATFSKKTIETNYALWTPQKKISGSMGLAYLTY